MARINSRDLKLAVMAWLRFGKRMPVVCTEAGPFNADVLGLSEKMGVEVEVKISRDDMYREFDKKERKHFLYETGKGWYVPNYFYFAVPENLVDRVRPIVEKHMPKAGILAFRGWRGWRVTDSLSVVNRPKKLSDALPSPKLVQSATLRMSSELVALYTAAEQLKADKLDDVRNAVVEAARRLAGALDVEDTTADLEYRAAELALAVESIQPEAFRALPDEAKQKWLQAALYLQGEPGNKSWPLCY